MVKIDTTHIYTGKKVIPESVTHNGKTYKVTDIGAGAFDGSFIESITIPKSVTSIGDSAFRCCEHLTSINIPNSVTSIGRNAFAGCPDLSSVNIPDISSWCTIIFSNPEANPLYNSGHLYINGKEITKLDIPDSLTIIRNYTFYGCSGLTEINIPNSVTSIGGCAFRRCENLRSVTISNSVKKIGPVSFAENENLKDIYINSETPPKYSFIKDSDGQILPDRGIISIDNQCTLHVPKGCKEVYEKEYPWCDFYKIIDDL